MGEAVKYFRSREDSLEFWLSFFLISGAVMGTVFCNRMDQGMKEELWNLEGSMVTAAVLSKMNFWGLFLEVLKRRMGQLLLGFLFAMTQASPLLFLAASGYLGFSAAVTVCTLTMAGGLMGLVRFLAFVFPQGIFYGAVFYVLAWWMQTREKRLTVPAGVSLAAATILGAAAESFVNPWIVAWILGK